MDDDELNRRMTVTCAKNTTARVGD